MVLVDLSYKDLSCADLGAGLFEGSKPRLEYFKSLLSMEGFDLNTVVYAYSYWVNFTEYLVFKGEKRGTHEFRFKAVKCAKRGNDVYNWRVNKRFKELNSLKEVTFFDPRGNVKKTRGLFVTLKINANLWTISEAWENIGGFYNKWLTKLRKRYGHVDALRVWEAGLGHEDNEYAFKGYPHVHCLLFFYEHEFEVFRHNGAWRIEEKGDLEWGYGFVDVEALRSLREGVSYVTKYLGKLHRWGVDSEVFEGIPNDTPRDNLVDLPFHASRLTLSLMWVFQKQAFSLSHSYYYCSDCKKRVKKGVLVCPRCGGAHIVAREGLVEGIRRMHNSNCLGKVKVVGQVDLLGAGVWKWILLGFLSGSPWGAHSPWVKEVKLAELREWENSGAFRSRFMKKRCFGGWAYEERIFD